MKILTNTCNRETINYTPSRDLWLNKLYFFISNEQLTLVLQSTAETQAQQSIGLMQTMTLNSFVTMHRKKKIGFTISLKLKE